MKNFFRFFFGFSICWQGVRVRTPIVFFDLILGDMAWSQRKRVWGYKIFILPESFKVNPGGMISFRWSLEKIAKEELLYS